MPGIHLRAFSHFDWLDSEKESLLTIPGSYWLCHKKNIYKFIFRYHRTIRNTVKFLYGRELLKIIRRIIKCHPTQGQQFSTQHLLVTYNCTSWTRQDKMFAILKFQQRTNAAAFSYAFVLTISICSSSESLLFDLKYPKVDDADTEKKGSKTVICATEKFSSKKISLCQNKKDHISKFNDDTLNKASKLIVNSNLQDNNIQNSINFHDNLDAKIKNVPTETYHVNELNTKLRDNMIYENKSYSTTNYERGMEQHAINSTQEESLRATEKTNKIKTSNIDKNSKSVAIQKQDQEIQDIPTCKIFSSLKFSVTGIINDSVDKLSVSNKFSFDKNLIEEDSTVTNKDGLDNKKMTNETIVDSNNVPHQCFIKKEIENAKRNTRLNMFSATCDQHMQTNLETEVKNINKDLVTKMRENNVKSIQAENEKEHYDKMPVIKSQRNDNQHIRMSMNAHNNQLQNNAHNKWYKAHKQKGREFEKKTIPEDKVLRSSNITDLVMEGLMFTIRQDQDSIAVIEQKTKLEVDEVLENSEKVETKAGEKCLLNSSLLRLENLVTMIDSSHDKNKHRKISNAINGNVYSSSFNILNNNSIHNLDVNFIDKRLDKSSVPSYDNLNTMSYLTPYKSRWQYFSSNIKNGDSCSVSGNTVEKSNQLIEWQSGNEQNRKNKYNISEMEKEEEDISNIFLQSSIFSSDKTNAGLQNKDLLMNDTNIKRSGKCDTSIKRHSSLPSFCSSSSPSKMTSKEISTISEQSADSDKLSRQKAKLPRIISDKVITVEQIPLALQNIVHTYRKRRFSSTTNNEECKQQNTMTLTGNVISDTVSSDNKCINSHTANNSSFIKLADSEGMKSKKNKSCITINKNIQETATCAKNIQEKNNDIHQHTSRRNSSSKHGSPRKLQDITDDFYYDLLHVHNKDNAIQQRCLRQRRRSLNNLNDTKNNNIRIEMLKFIQDITEGAKVVVKRLNIERKETVNSIC
ncbi:uncharacterized protein [Linepithema humile]|uniref:uncharacterized protein isoform X1 n=1 Tax=Linepithema humile TaxID=83485 RepID=UPI00351E11EF